MIPLTSEDYLSLWVTVRLASTVTLILLIIAIPLAWWLSRKATTLRRLIQALVALPLVLPPTVLGFYLLVVMGPSSPVGWLTESLGIGLLPFTFTGIVIGSLFYSLPFAVQPVYHAFESMGRRPMEVAATLGARPLFAFFTVAMPLARKGIATAGVLTFAHTVGEFGVILMLGGGITGQTKVASVQIYNHVEAMQYGAAHWLSAGMILFSFAVLLFINARVEKRGEQMPERAEVE